MTSVVVFFLCGFFSDKLYLFCVCVFISFSQKLKITSGFCGYGQLVDLEKLVKEEIKLRDKAERKLRLLKKKLESFNKSKQLDHSDSSEKCENSCGSSSITSISKYSETSETKHPAKNSPLPEDDVVHNHNTPSSTTKDSDSQVTDNSSSNLDSQIQSENPNPSYETEDLKNNESRY